MTAIVAVALALGLLGAPGPLLPNKQIAGAALTIHRAGADPAEAATSPVGNAAPATQPPAPPATTSSSVWDELVACEANRDPSKGPTGWATTATGNGYYFAIQATPGTWLAYGGTQAELDATSRGIAPSRARLIEVATAILHGQGPGAWPNCWPG